MQAGEISLVGLDVVVPSISVWVVLDWWGGLDSLEGDYIGLRRVVAAFRLV